MLPRPFDKDPDRWMWLSADDAGARAAHALLALARDRGRGAPSRLLLYGAYPSLARGLGGDGRRLHVRDPDPERVIALLSGFGGPGTSLLDARAGALPEGVHAAFAPAGILCHVEDDARLQAHLEAVTASLLPGGLYVVEVWHPRLLAADAAPPRSARVQGTGSFPAARLLYRFARGEGAPPTRRLDARLESTAGWPLASSSGTVRLLTLSEWRAVFRKVPGLEEAALLGPFGAPGRASQEQGDRCAFVLTRTG